MPREARQFPIGHPRERRHRGARHAVSHHLDQVIVCGHAVVGADDVKLTAAESADARVEETGYGLFAGAVSSMAGGAVVLKQNTPLTDQRADLLFLR